MTHRVTYLALIAAVLLAGCKSDPEGSQSLLDARAEFESLYCSQAECPDPKADSGSFGFLELLDNPNPIARRYSNRVDSDYELVYEDGSPVWSTTCAVFPDDCRVDLYTKVLIDYDDPAEVIDLILGDWRYWWRHSEIPEGGTQYYDQADSRLVKFLFYPLGHSLLKVGLTLHRPIADYPDPASLGYDGVLWDWAVPITLSEAFEGQMYLLVRKMGDAVMLKEVWNQVKISAPLNRLPAIAAKLHLATGAGRLIPPDTGWIGLLDVLETGQHSDDLGPIPYRQRIRSSVISITNEDAPVIRCKTEVDRIEASPEEVLAAVYGPWDWWVHGRVENYIDHRDSITGESTKLTYRLVPLTLLGQGAVWVDEVMYPPREIDYANGRAWRIDIELFGDHFRGQAHYLIRERSDGHTSLVAEFDRVSVHSWLSWVPGWAAKLHLMAEAGTLPPPKRGSGLVGLINTLECSDPAFTCRDR